VSAAAPPRGASVEAASPSSADGGAARRSLAWGPFLWGPRRDLAAFAASAVVALGLALLAPRLAGPEGALPAWGFLALVVAIDVAHVWSTLFRTYLDRGELARRPALYAGTPLACFALGAAVHAFSAVAFWRTLAYVAAFHFVRQQIGWVAIYRRRAGDHGRLSRLVDEVAVYAAAGYPLLFWHATARPFAWFVDGDFVSLPQLAAILPATRWVWLGALAIYAAKSVARAIRTRTVELGKHVVVASTAATWYVGIVGATSDFAFTSANVIVHGVPYAFLLYAYAKARSAEAPKSLASRALRFGVPGFVTLLFAIAFVEEMVWDRFVWHAHPELFGAAAARLTPAVLTFVVPLLAVPQATHYVLDAVLWRRRDTGPAQAKALGFGDTESVDRRGQRADGGVIVRAA
jgi:hypothetical protein